MKGKKISMKEIRVCLMLIAVGIFAYVYLIMCHDINSKTEKLKEQKKVVEQQIEDRRALLMEAVGVEEKIDELKGQMQNILKLYPSELTLPDVFMFLQKMEQDNKLNPLKISVSDISTFYDTTVPRILEEDTNSSNTQEIIDEIISASAGDVADSQVQNDAINSIQEILNSENSSGMTGIKSTISIDYQGTYEEVKRFIKYIEDYPERITLDSINMAYDEKGMTVTGSLTISLYAIQGNGMPYHAPELNSAIGKNNIFK